MFTGVPRSSGKPRSNFPPMDKEQWGAQKPMVPFWLRAPGTLGASEHCPLCQPACYAPVDVNIFGFSIRNLNFWHPIPYKLSPISIQLRAGLKPIGPIAPNWAPHLRGGGGGGAPEGNLPWCTDLGVSWLGTWADWKSSQLGSRTS